MLHCKRMTRRPRGSTVAHAEIFGKPRARILAARWVLVALAAASQGALAGCAPTLPRVPVSSAMLAGQPLRTITVMPIDLTMEADGPDGNLSEPGSYDAAVRALPPIAAATLTALDRRGFAHEEAGWDGTVAARGNRRVALDPVGMANLADWLLNYTYAALDRQQGAGSYVPPLPFTTDATLFVGGYAHLHRDQPYRRRVGRDVGIGIAIGVGILAILVLLIVTKGHFRFPHFGGVGGAILNAVVLPAAIGARLVLTAPRLPLALAFIPHGHVCGPACNPYLGVHDGIYYGGGRPTLSPAQRSANFLAVGATLVDNRSGQIIWTAAQPMEIDPVDEPELTLAITHLLEQLPAARP